MARRTGVEAARRQALIEAAIAEIGAAGSLDVTVEKIARHAGVSAALAHHYFGSKDRILLAAMWAILAQYGASVRERLARARTPRARLDAILEASFDEFQAAPHVVTAWLLFYVQALHSARAARLLHLYRRRLHSNLLHETRRLAPPKQAECLAMTLGALIDGLYLRCAPSDDALAREAAIAAARATLDAALGSAPGVSRKLELSDAT